MKYKVYSELSGYEYYDNMVEAEDSAMPGDVIWEKQPGGDWEVVRNVAGFTDEQDLLRHDPLLIDEVAGVRFYEHPKYGDEACLVMVYDGEVFESEDFWDVPHRQEVLEWLEEKKLN